jgi:hypothetical protein
VEDKFRCAQFVYSIDMRVQDRRLNGGSSNGCGAGWAVEFDGTSHFLAGRTATGANRS